MHEAAVFSDADIARAKFKCVKNLAAGKFHKANVVPKRQNGFYSAVCYVARGNVASQSAAVFKRQVAVKTFHKIKVPVKGVGDKVAQIAFLLSDKALMLSDRRIGAKRKVTSRDFCSHVFVNLGHPIVDKRVNLRVGRLILFYQARSLLIAIQFHKANRAKVAAGLRQKNVLPLVVFDKLLFHHRVRMSVDKSVDAVRARDDIFASPRN